jgi:hypothetical protein
LMLFIIIAQWPHLRHSSVEIAKNLSPQIHDRYSNHNFYHCLRFIIGSNIYDYISCHPFVLWLELWLLSILKYVNMKPAYDVTRELWTRC